MFPDICSQCLLFFLTQSLAQFPNEYGTRSLWKLRDNFNQRDLPCLAFGILHLLPVHFPPVVKPQTTDRTLEVDSKSLYFIQKVDGNDEFARVWENSFIHAMVDDHLVNPLPKLGDITNNNWVVTDLQFAPHPPPKQTPLSFLAYHCCDKQQVVCS